jgi:hypothetical protein
MDTTTVVNQAITCTHIWTLIVIIVFAGVLGGIVNYFMNNVSKIWDWYDFIKSLIFGVVASATVPLFLETVSSQLIYESQTKPLKYFVFGGFCLLASVFSSKFLQSLADRILKELNEVKKENKDNKEKVDAMVSQKSDDKQTEKFADTKLKAQAGDDVEKVIIALQDDKFTFRTINGLATASSTSESTVRAILLHLEDKDYARQFKRSDGVTLWTLTTKGQRLAIPKE